MEGNRPSGGRDVAAEPASSFFGFTGLSSITSGLDFSSVSLLPDMDQLRKAKEDSTHRDQLGRRETARARNEIRKASGHGEIERGFAADGMQTQTHGASPALLDPKCDAWGSKGVAESPGLSLPPSLPPAYGAKSGQSTSHHVADRAHESGNRISGRTCSHDLTPNHYSMPTTPDAGGTLPPSPSRASFAIPSASLLSAESTRNAAADAAPRGGPCDDDPLAMLERDMAQAGVRNLGAAHLEAGNGSVRDGQSNGGAGSADRPASSSALADPKYANWSRTPRRGQAPMAGTESNVQFETPTQAPPLTVSIDDVIGQGHGVRGASLPASSVSASAEPIRASISAASGAGQVREGSSTSGVSSDTMWGWASGAAAAGRGWLSVSTGLDLGWAGVGGVSAGTASVGPRDGLGSGIESRGGGSSPSPPLSPGTAALAGRLVGGRSVLDLGEQLGARAPQGDASVIDDQVGDPNSESYPEGQGLFAELRWAVAPIA